MTSEGWVEQEHPIFGDHGREPAAKTEAIIGRTGVFPKKQWIKDGWSIIEPCEITFGNYELYPVDGDVRRFDTLEEAQHYADTHEPSHESKDEEEAEEDESEGLGE